MLSTNLFAKIKKEGKIMQNLKISSPAFQNNEYIPKKYSCQGEDLNPPLIFENIPQNAKSLALIVDDPDAPMGNWDHWIVFNISPQTKDIKEGEIPKGSLQGINDFGKLDYGGPCPPPGRPHRYFFKLFTLDIVLNLKQGIRKNVLEKAMEGHILGQAQLIGLYKR
jgi:Raf kinase inhibitor-like YbhB/YbcL family protein